MEKSIVQRSKIIFTLIFITSSLLSSTLIHAQAPQKLSFAERLKNQNIKRSLQVVLHQAQLAASSLSAQSIIQNQVLNQLHALQEIELNLTAKTDLRKLNLITHQKRVLHDSFLRKILPQLEPLQTQTQQHQLKAQEEMRRCESENPGCKNYILAKLREKKQLLAALVPSSNQLSPELVQFKTSTFSTQIQPQPSMSETPCDHAMQNYVDVRLKTPTESPATQNKIDLFKILKLQNTIAQQKLNKSAQGESETCILFNERNSSLTLPLPLLIRYRTAALISKYAKGQEEQPARSLQSWLSSFFPNTLARKSLQAQKCAQVILSSIPQENRSFLEQEVTHFEAYLRTAKARKSLESHPTNTSSESAPLSPHLIEGLTENAGNPLSLNFMRELDGCSLHPQHIKTDFLGQRTTLRRTGESSRTSAAASTTREQPSRAVSQPANAQRGPSNQKTNTSLGLRAR